MSAAAMVTPLEIASPYLTPDQAALYLHVEVRTLANWRQSGKGPAYRKHGRSVVYTQAALDAWSAKQEFQSTGTPRPKE